MVIRNGDSRKCAELRVTDTDRLGTSECSRGTKLPPDPGSYHACNTKRDS
jgi:hypothetical protein